MRIRPAATLRTAQAFAADRLFVCCSMCRAAGTRRLPSRCPHKRAALHRIYSELLTLRNSSFCHFSVPSTTMTSVCRCARTLRRAVISSAYPREYVCSSARSCPPSSSSPHGVPPPVGPSSLVTRARAACWLGIQTIPFVCRLRFRCICVAVFVLCARLCVLRPNPCLSRPAVPVRLSPLRIPQSTQSHRFRPGRMLSG